MKQYVHICHLSSEMVNGNVKNKQRTEKKALARTSTSPEPQKYLLSNKNNIISIVRVIAKPSDITQQTQTKGNIEITSYRN